MLFVSKYFNLTVACFAVILLLIFCGCSKPQPGPRPLGYVDSPQPNQRVSGTVLMTGWAADESGIRSVCFFVDQGPASCTQDMSISRQDVAANWPSIPDSQQSGWEMPLDTATLTPGEHKLQFVATAKSGASRELGVITVKVTR